MEHQSAIVTESSTMENKWKRDVSEMNSVTADLMRIQELLTKEYSADKCLDQVSNLDDKLREAFCRLMDSCVPICLELERVRMARAAAVEKEEKPKSLGDVVDELDEKSSLSQWIEETYAPAQEQVVSEEVKSDDDKRLVPQEAVPQQALLDPVIPKTNMDEIKPEKSIVQESDQKSVDVVPLQVPADVKEVNRIAPEDKDEKKTSVGAVGENLSGAKTQYQVVSRKTKARKAKKAVPVQAHVATIILDAPEGEEEKKKTSVGAVEDEQFPPLKVPIKNEEEFRVVITKKNNTRNAKKSVPDSANPVPKVGEMNKKSFVDAVKVVTSSAKPLSKVVIPVDKQNKGAVQVEVKVPAEKIGHVVGKQFSNMNRLESEYGIKLTLPAKGGSDIMLTGPADRAAAAKEDILSRLPWTTDYPLEKGYHGAIMGPKGAIINGLRKKHNVIIDLNPDSVIIRGPKKQCDDALSSIKSIVAEQKKVLAARPIKK